MKPPNILFHKGRVKLADFGFAKLVDKLDNTMKTMIGTPYYMSPQILSEQIYTEKCDVWATGIIFYQIMHKKLPWVAKSIPELYKVIRNTPLKLNPLIPSEIKELLVKMLAFKEEDRLSWQEIAAHPAFEVLQEKQVEKKE